MSRYNPDSTKAAYIVGAAETPLGISPYPEPAMLALATREALNEASLSLSDVDAVMVAHLGDMSSVRLADYLGVKPRYTDTTDIGGASVEASLHHAMLAIAAGRIDVALIGFAWRPRSKRSRDQEGGRTHSQEDPGSHLAQFESPYGLPSPIGHFALVASRHMALYGTTREHLAHVAVTARKWAKLNPKAWSRDDLTVEEVLGSRSICEPLSRLDCCLITDGGGVIVVASHAVAQAAEKPPVRLLGAGESHTHHQLTQMPELIESAGVRSAHEALGMAGIRPSDVDVFEPYDAFTIMPILALEDVGFCERGDGGPFAASGAMEPGGTLPSLTSGGGLSYNHPGAFGVLLLIEAVRQLRGEAGDRQVNEAGIAVVHAIGGLNSAASTVVLAHE